MRKMVMGTTVLAIGLVACGGGPGSTQPPRDGPSRLTIEANEYSFDVPATMAPGRTTIVLENVGQERHFLEMVKITGNKTIQQLLRLSDEESRKFIEEAGGIPPVKPGGSKTGTFALTPGRYGIVCFIEAPDGTPHAFKGMAAEFEVR